jgi:hypothetical protein
MEVQYSKIEVRAKFALALVFEVLLRHSGAIRTTFHRALMK